MKQHRNPRPRLPKQPSPDNGAPTFDVAGALDILREIIGRTEALVAATEDLLEQEPWGNDEEEDERRAERIAHLLASAKEAAHAAVDAGAKIAEGLARHRAVSA